MWKNKKILFQLSGSIACYKSCELISALVKEGADVQCVCSESALKFIGEMTLEGLTRNRVITDTFAPGGGHSHIDLIKKADLILLCPASANKINQLAAGIATDMIGSLFLAFDFKRPYVVVPAMNTRMYQHPITTKSLGVLKEFGIEVLKTDEGSLACGDFGEGRMLAPEVILNKIEALMENSHD